MVRSLWLLGLAGCPYVFGPPDLSNVAQTDDTPPPADTDTDTDSDSDTDTDTDTDTDSGGTVPIDTGPNEDAPAAVSLTVLPRSDGLEFEFLTLDPNDDLIGGTLEITNGIQVWSFVIPTDIDFWVDGDVSRTSVDRPEGWLFPDLDLDGTSDCDGPGDEQFTMTVTDFAGNQSLPLVYDMHVEMLGNLPEIGNTWPVDLTEVTVPPPFTACFQTETGDLDPANDQMELRLELEGLWFEVDTQGRYQVDVTWEQAVDFDAYVYYWPNQDTMPADGISDTILVMESYGFTHVESGAWNSQAATQWAVQVAYYPDPAEEAPPFKSFVLVTPD